MSRSVAALFKRLTQGVHVVGVAHGEVRNAFTASWVMQVSFEGSNTRRWWPTRKSQAMARPCAECAIGAMAGERGLAQHPSVDAAFGSDY